jgi:hypothetical protein
MIGADRRVDPSSIGESIAMLETHLDAEAIAPLIAILRAIAQTPQDRVLLDRLSGTFDDLGMLQGAVLTYAPIVAGLLSDDPFEDSGST